jgi:hypothetical protein
MFVQYHRSGQHDPEMDEWRWARAAGWKTPGTNNIIPHQQAMIYSIAVLDLCDFKSIGHKMPRVQVLMHRLTMAHWWQSIK